MKFNINNYKGNYAMHCKTEEEAEIFCEYLDNVGKKWITGSSYLDENNWDDFKDKTCYCFNEGLYGNCDNKSLFMVVDYTILEFSDFEWDECNMIDELSNRITDEITAFRMSEKKKSVGEIYDDWYEVCIKEELYNLFMNADLDGYEKIISWLNTKEQPLEFLYRTVINSEYGFVHRWDALLEWLDDLCLNDETD